ncbi:MAG: hypothetical protein R3Y53_06515, partial [Bacillota bacterium]
PYGGNGSVFYKMTGDHRSPLRGERFSFLQNDGRPQVAPTWNGSVFYKMTGDHRSPLRGTVQFSTK